MERHLSLVHSAKHVSSARPPTFEGELRRLPPTDLAKLRFALVVALETTELGDQASRLIGRLARAARIEARRRRHPGGTPRAA
jgi:hypothetical protein